MFAWNTYIGKSDLWFMLIRGLSKHLLVRCRMKYDNLRSKTHKLKCFLWFAVRIFNSKWEIISDRYNTIGRKWMVVFECCCRHSSQGSVVNEKVIKRLICCVMVEKLQGKRKYVPLRPESSPKVAVFEEMHVLASSHFLCIWLFK